MDRYVGLDDKDEAFRWLDQAAEERSAALIYAQSLSWLEPLRSDPRFEELLRRIGLGRDVAPRLLRARERRTIGLGGLGGGP